MSYDSTVSHLPTLPVGGDVPIRVMSGGALLNGALPMSGGDGLEDLLSGLKGLSKEDKDDFLQEIKVKQSCLGATSVMNNNCRAVTKVLRLMLQQELESGLPEVRREAENTGRNALADARLAASTSVNTATASANAEKAKANASKAAANAEKAKENADRATAAVEAQRKAETDAATARTAAAEAALKVQEKAAANAEAQRKAKLEKNTANASAAAAAAEEQRQAEVEEAKRQAEAAEAQRKAEAAAAAAAAATAAEAVAEAAAETKRKADEVEAAAAAATAAVEAAAAERREEIDSLRQEEELAKAEEAVAEKAAAKAEKEAEAKAEKARKNADQGRKDRAAADAAASAAAAETARQETEKARVAAAAAAAAEKARVAAEAADARKKEGERITFELQQESLRQFAREQAAAAKAAAQAAQAAAKPAADTTIPSGSVVHPPLEPYCGIAGGGGNSCYMNSAIQYLYSIPPLRELLQTVTDEEIDDFISAKDVDCTREEELNKDILKSLRSLFSKFKSGETPIRKDKEYSTLLLSGGRQEWRSGDMEDGFEPNQQSDAGEFVTTLYRRFECFRDIPIFKKFYDSIKFNTYKTITCKENRTPIFATDNKDGKYNIMNTITLPIGKNNTIQEMINFYLSPESPTEDNNKISACSGDGTYTESQLYVNIPDEMRYFTFTLVLFTVVDGRSVKITKEIPLSKFIYIDSTDSQTKDKIRVYFRIKGAICHIGRRPTGGHYVYEIFENGEPKHIADDSSINDYYIDDSRKQEDRRTRYIFLYERYNPTDLEKASIRGGGTTLKRNHKTHKKHNTQKAKKTKGTAKK
jgi:hypothetical protein